jgi:hypothetical protein
MTIDEKAMASVFEDAFVPFVIRHHGNRAGPVVRSILSFIKVFYEHVAPDGQNEAIVIFQTLDDASRPITDPGIECASLHELVNKATGPCAIQVIPSGAFIIWAQFAVDPEHLSQTSVVYSFYQGIERFHANRETKLIAKVIPGRSSNFAVPTFNILKDALAAYRDTMVRTSACEILSGAWYDPSRLYFKAAPEATIRRSLTRFLKITFSGDAEVRPEQIVDESHPVDIKVTWFMTNRLALIEIKWLGKSRDDTKVSASHSDSRANKGAKQLAEYMDANKIQAPVHETRGYLVVVDARRAKLNLKRMNISIEDGMKYSNAEITYKPKYHEARKDFEQPLRMFVDPICSPQC